MKDFSFQGKVYLGTRLAGGLAGALTWVGDAPKCNLSLKIDKDTRKESYSGSREQSAVLIKGRSGTLALTLNYFSSYNLAIGVHGTLNTVEAGTATAEPLPTITSDDITAGTNVVKLDHNGVSSVVIHDSAGSPATLDPGTDYDVIDAAGGLVAIKNLGTFVLPFKANYSYGASVDLAMMQATPPERYFLLSGTNTVTGEPIVCRLYRAQFDPMTGLDLIQDSFGTIDLTADLLYDAEAAADPLLGGLGKLEMVGATS